MVARGGELQSPEGASEQDASVNASVRARALQFAWFREARVSACSRGSSLRPPCPAGRSLPPSPSPLPGGPGAGTPRPSRQRRWWRLVGEP